MAKLSRRETQAVLGGAFDVRRFNDKLLGCSALPLAVFEERMKKWVTLQKKD